MRGNLLINEIKGPDAGHAFEHYVFLEFLAYKELTKASFDTKYWRRQSGLEVDFVLARGNIAIEAKIANPIQKRDIKGLVEFAKENTSQKK